MHKNLCPNLKITSRLTNCVYCSILPGTFASCFVGVLIHNLSFSLLKKNPTNTFLSPSLTDDKHWTPLLWESYILHTLQFEVLETKVNIPLLFKKTQNSTSTDHSEACHVSHVCLYLTLVRLSNMDQALLCITFVSNMPLDSVLSKMMTWQKWNISQQSSASFFSAPLPVPVNLYYGTTSFTYT